MENPVGPPARKVGNRVFSTISNFGNQNSAIDRKRMWNETNFDATLSSDYEMNKFA